MTTKLCFLQVAPAPTTLTDVLAARKHFDASKGLMTALGGILTKAGDNTAISLEVIAKGDDISLVVVAPEDQAGVVDVFAHQFFCPYGVTLEHRLDDAVVVAVRAQDDGVVVP